MADMAWYIVDADDHDLAHYGPFATEDDAQVFQAMNLRFEEARGPIDERAR